MSWQLSSCPEYPLKRVYWAILDPSPPQCASNSEQSQYSVFSLQETAASEKVEKSELKSLLFDDAKALRTTQSAAVTLSVAGHWLSVGLHMTPLFGGRQGRATDKTPY